VLIAEDDGDIREVLKEFLSKAGYRPITAQDRIEALDWLSSMPVDLIHGGHPDASHRRAQVDQTHPAGDPVGVIPILIQFGYANLDRYQNLPVDGILLKPFELSALLESRSVPEPRHRSRAPGRGLMLGSNHLRSLAQSDTFTNLHHLTLQFFAKTGMHGFGSGDA